MTNETTQSFNFNFQDQIEYPQEGVLSKVLFKDENCQYTLFCLSAETEISEHTSSRNATVNVLAGKGTLNVAGMDIALTPGVFVFMKANAPHALQAAENLAFLLTLSSKSEA